MQHKNTQYNSLLAIKTYCENLTNNIKNKTDLELLDIAKANNSQSHFSILNVEVSLNSATIDWEQPCGISSIWVYRLLQDLDDVGTVIPSPFTIEEKQILLEAENLELRKNKIAEILKTYTFDIYKNNTIQ